MSGISLGQEKQRFLMCYCLWVFVSVLLLFSCSGKLVRLNPDQNKFKILNSFEQEDTMSQIWPELFKMYQRIDNQPISVQNYAPRALFERLRSLYSLDSLPNVVYLNPNSEAARFMIRQDLLQNLRLEQESGYLSKIPFSTMALTPQEYARNMLWIIPMTFHLAGILFTNEQILYEEGLQVPETIEELQQTIATLREKGYDRPLVLGHSYNGDLLNNILGMIVGRHLQPEFFKEATENPAMFQSPEFRMALNMYLDYLSEDGLLPQNVRRLIHGEGLILFNTGKSVFLLGDSDDEESTKLGENQGFRNLISWRAFPAEATLTDPERRNLIPGHIRSGYSITTMTYAQAKMQARAMQFLGFMFTDGVRMYAGEDNENRITSVNIEIESENSLPFYVKKKEFYGRATSFIYDIRNTMLEGEYETLEEGLNDVIDGVDRLGKIINIFYMDALNRNFNLEIMRSDAWK